MGPRGASRGSEPALRVSELCCASKRDRACLACYMGKYRKDKFGFGWLGESGSVAFCHDQSATQSQKRASPLAMLNLSHSGERKRVRLNRLRESFKGRDRH